MFSPLFKSILTLKLINRNNLTHNTIIIVQLRDIWNCHKPHFIHVVEHNHANDDTSSMWNGCLHATQALTEVYETEPQYNTHSLLLSQLYISIIDKN